VNAPIQSHHLFLIAESRSNLSQQVFFKSGGLVSAFPKTPCVAGQANFPPSVCIKKFLLIAFLQRRTTTTTAVVAAAMGIFVMAEVPLHVRSSTCALGVEGLGSWRATLANAQNLILISSS